MMKPFPPSRLKRILPIFLVAGVLVMLFLPRPLNKMIHTSPGMRYSYQSQFGSPVVNGENADALISAMGNIRVVFAGWSRGVPGNGPLLVLRTQDNHVESLSCVSGENMIYKSWIVGMVKYRPVDGDFQEMLKNQME